MVGILEISSGVRELSVALVLTKPASVASDLEALLLGNLHPPATGEGYCRRSDQTCP
jgi:hypothetical protein